MSRTSNNLNTGRSTPVFKAIISHRLFIPVAFLAFLLLLNVFINPGFLRISMGTDSSGNPVLIGNLINILNNVRQSLLFLRSA